MKEDPKRLERWTVKKLLEWTQGYLEGKGSEAPRREAEELLAHLLGIGRLDLYLDLHRPLTGGELSRFKELVKRRARGEPLQYITGQQGFWKHEFHVEPGVLIPRPDSEVLVQATLEALRGMESPFVLDVGTGTGCLIISILADLPQACGVALDISQQALRLTRKNARKIRVEERLALVRGDLLTPFKKGVFHAIISNPPYIAPEEWGSLPTEVKEHEPYRALQGGEGGLYYISQLISRAWEYLKPDGVLVLEMGWRQKDKVKILLKGKPYKNVEFLTDLGGRYRVVRAWRR